MLQTKTLTDYKKSNLLQYLRVKRRKDTTIAKSFRLQSIITITH